MSDHDDTESEFQPSSTGSTSSDDEINNQSCPEIEHSAASTEGRKTKHTKDRSVAKENKEKRLQGEAYLGRKKHRFEIERPKRQVKERCACKSKSFSCVQFSDGQRAELFNTFWTLMSWRERKLYIGQLVEKKPVKQRKTKNEESRRNESLFYNLPLSTGKVKVCKKIFLNTFAIGEWSVRAWVTQPVTGNKDQTNQLQRRSTRMTPRQEKK